MPIQKRCTAKSLATTEVVDTEAYVIDKIAANKLIKHTIHYKVKWEGYSSLHDSWECEWRMNCDEKIIEFVKSLISPMNYVDRVQAILEDIELYHTDPDKVLKIIDPLSTLGLTTVHCGNVKFVDMDSVESKTMYLKHLRDTKQHYILHCALIPPENEIEADEEKYRKELQYRLKIFYDYPFVSVMFPIERNSLFYSPPPLDHLLFEPITEEILESNVDHLIVKSSKTFGFNDAQPFVQKSYFNVQYFDEDPRYAHHFDRNKGRKLYNGMKRYEYSEQPRFNVNLVLTQNVPSGWVLKAEREVDRGVPIVLMTGIIRPQETAHKSLLEEGECVAFTSFIEIPNTGMCLDRREYHDFSKYIQHNCHPTCSVRLVDSGNDIPDLVVYSIVPIGKENDFEISLDYYNVFKKDVSKYFRSHKPKIGKVFTLYENETNFVHCQCNEKKCREVLYVDRSLIAEDKEATKQEKLENLDPTFEFAGLSLAESVKIWKIDQGKFVR